MITVFSKEAQIAHPLTRMGLSVELETLSCSTKHFHIASSDAQSSLVFAVPIALHDDSGVAHVLEHLLLTGSSGSKGESLFFRTRAESSAVDMNAVTNSKYLAVHFTSEDPDEYFRLMERFSAAMFEPNWQLDQLKREAGDRTTPGVIINEMAGVFAEPEHYWSLRTYAGLFAAGSAQFNPGGDPSHIADVSADSVNSFWNQHFSTMNLIVVSYGSLSSTLIRENLERCLSGFKNDRRAHVSPSVPIRSQRVSNHISASKSSQMIASGLLLTNLDGNLAPLEIALLSDFSKRFNTDICQMGKREGIDFTVAPTVKEMDGDQFLFTLCTISKASEIENLWLTIARIYDSIAESLTPEIIFQLGQKVAYNYFSLGSEKFSTGIAASYELLNDICGSISPGLAEQSPNLTDDALATFRSNEVWKDVIERAIRKNPAQVILDCDNKHLPVHQKFPNNSNQGIQGELVEVNPVSTAAVETGKGIEQGSDRHPELPLNWLHPKVNSYQSYALYHYRLPRPRAASLKVCITIPRKVIELSGWSALQQLPDLFAGTCAVNRLQLKAKIEAKKQPGYAGYQVILSLTTVGDTQTVVNELENIVGLLSVTSLGNLQSMGSNIWPDSAGQSTPPHKLAILRSASQILDLGKAKLRLAGCSLIAEDQPSENDLVKIEWSELELQPGAIFLTTEFDESHIVDLSVSKEQPIRREITTTIDDPPVSSEVNLSTCANTESIPGRLNYCARVWTLSPDFGICPQRDAVPYIFATLVTNLCLEPVLRGQRRAYAASADVDSELGVLAMFSFRDPNSNATDHYFLQAFEQVFRGDFRLSEFENAQQRTLSRLQDKGSFDQRCEKQFDRLIQGYDQNYFEGLYSAVTSMSFQYFKETIPDYFQQSVSARYALVGEDHQTD